MTAEAILERLQKVRRTGDRRWLACCPAHDDRGPSLSLRELDDGRLLLHCFAGCAAHDVVAAAGLELHGLVSRHGRLITA
jgi:DNA primase